TPVLPVPLQGRAYFVSNGGEEFPNLIIVLSGYGTTVHLVGSTFINPKTNITSSTFKTVPDVPVGTFELTLPQGKYSALAANGNLCTAKKLAMPTSFLAQNGTEIHTSTPITPTGCAKHKATKKTKKSKPSHKGTNRRKKKCDARQDRDAILSRAAPNDPSLGQQRPRACPPRRGRWFDRDPARTHPRRDGRGIGRTRRG